MDRSIAIQSKAYFIGYCSLPFEEREKFVEVQIKENIFKEYREGICRNNSANHIGKEKYQLDNKSLYSPTCFYLWGKYDVCVISEVDDLEFATRFFRPYNPIGKNDDPLLQNFDYKVLTGINPTKCGNTEEKLPYIAISELKVNSAFMTGNGLSLLSKIVDKVYTEIKHMVDILPSANGKINNKKPGLRINICESYSYHELVITIESNSIYWLKDIITKVRSLQLCNLEKPNDFLSNSIFEGFTGQLTNKDVSNHFFESTLTTFGIHSDIHNHDFRQNKWDGMPFTNEEKIVFISKWNIKPGHFNEVLESLKPKLKDNNQIYAVAGKGDMLLISHVQINNDKINEQEYKHHPLAYPGYLLEADNGKKLHSHLIETYTTIGFSIDGEYHLDTEQEVHQETHHDIHKFLQKLKIDSIDITRIRKGMKKLRVPKVLADKVVKLISNYNNAVVNTDMYAYYLELHFFIKESIIKKIDNYSKGAFSNFEDTKYYTWYLINKLELACNYLEYGFENRFYQSYWTSEMLEVNIDYSGGLQNLISAYDSCFKVLNNTYMSNRPNASFVCVKSEHKVSAMSYTILLNYLHLIQPYIFCAIATHETSNYAFAKLHQNNLDSKQIDSDIKVNLSELEYLLYQADIDPDLEDYSTAILSNTQRQSKFNDNNDSFKDFKRDLDKSRYKLSALINKITFKYFLTDYINFIYGYEGNFDLFCTTSWNYLIQMGSIYEKYEEMIPHAFLTMSLRMALIRKYSNNDGNYYPTNLEDFLRSPISQYKNEIDALIIKITRNGDLNKWFSGVSNNINTLFTTLKNKERDLENVDLVKKNINEFLLNYDDKVQIDETLETINTYFKINNNKINCLLPLYRNIISESVKYYSKDIRVLYREPTEGNPEIPALAPSQDNVIQFFIDPCGGIFVAGEKNRKNYLTIRIKFIRLMFHLSQLHKKEYVSKILDATNEKNM